MKKILVTRKLLKSNEERISKLWDAKLNLNDKGLSRTLILFGERELDHKIILEKVLKKNMKILDIGSNIGYYLLIERNLIGRKSKIIAVEPVPVS